MSDLSAEQPEIKTETLPIIDTPKNEKTPKIGATERLDNALSFIGVIVHSHSELSEDGLAFTPEKQAEYLENVINIGNPLKRRNDRSVEGITITEHSRHVEGLTDEERGQTILKQAQEIKQVNEKLGNKVPILSGVEANICRTGEPGNYKYKLDIPDNILSQLDVNIASLHTWEFREFSNPIGSIEEVIDAYKSIIDNPNVDVLGHFISGNIGPNREGTENLISAFSDRLIKNGNLRAELDPLFTKMAKNKVALEINFKDMMPDNILREVLMRAKEKGVLLSNGLDFHELRSIQDPDNQKKALYKSRIAGLLLNGKNEQDLDPELRLKIMDEVTQELALNSKRAYFKDQREERNANELIMATQAPGFRFWNKLINVIETEQKAGYTKEEVVNSSYENMKSWLSTRRSVK